MAAKSKQDCADKAGLLEKYNRRVADWSQAVQALSARAGIQDPDFLILLSVVDEARAKTQRAKAAYGSHVAEHGC